MGSKILLAFERLPEVFRQIRGCVGQLRVVLERIDHPGFTLSHQLSDLVKEKFFSPAFESLPASEYAVIEML